MTTLQQPPPRVGVLPSGVSEPRISLRAYRCPMFYTSLVTWALFEPDADVVGLTVIQGHADPPVVAWVFAVAQLSMYCWPLLSYRRTPVQSRRFPISTDVRHSCRLAVLRPQGWLNLRR